jgi:hypothetical protein
MESWLESNLPPVGKRYGGNTLQNLWYSKAREASLRKQPSTRIAPHSGVVCGRSVCDCPASVLLRKPCSKHASCFMFFTKGPIYGDLARRDRPKNGAKMKFAMEPEDVLCPWVLLAYLRYRSTRPFRIRDLVNML